ncbi:MAG: hypothetical protein PHF25_06280 [Candidatus Margulisbacteria bacterium]|nr:hypothetical protein [Candidatus Margulisiibacteriota bacterium]
MKKVIIALLMIGAMGWSVPSMAGTNGLIHMPAAVAVQYKEYDLGVNFQNSQTAKTGQYFANLGILDGFELGFIGNTQQEGVFVNVKYYMLSDKSEYPLGLATGITGLTSYSNTNLYMVVSKAFPNKLSGHFGFRSNLNSATIKAEVMFGVEMKMGEQLNFVSDIIGSDTAWDLSAGLRIKLSEDLMLNGYLEDILNSNDAKFTLGFSYHGIL